MINGGITKDLVFEDLLADKEEKNVNKINIGPSINILIILIITANSPTSLPIVKPAAVTWPTACIVLPIIIPISLKSPEKNVLIDSGSKKIPSVPSKFITDIDKATSSFFDFIIDEAPAIAEEPQIPFPIPISKDKEPERLKTLPIINEENIATIMIRMIIKITLVPIALRIERFKLAPINTIATLSNFFSEKLIP